MKLLIVDDHPGVRAMIRQLAALPRESVRECATGEDAVRIAREFFPEVVTMDFRLPGLNGLEATRAILALQPEAFVMVVSSYDLPELRQAAKAAGVRGFVTKDNLTELPGMLARRAAAVGTSSPSHLCPDTGPSGEKI